MILITMKKLLRLVILVSIDTIKALDGMYILTLGEIQFFRKKLLMCAALYIDEFDFYAEFDQQ